jgi:6-phosphogluconolactonase/glucosamine-6-phosphate isomerase/deaminase
MDDPPPPIELSPAAEATAPALPGVVVVRSDADAAIDALLADLFIHAGNCVRAFGDFHFAVSATSEVEPVLRRLLFDLAYRDFPWARTRVWMVEELGVEDDDPRQRWPGVRDHILAGAGVPEEQMHRILAREPGAAERYEALLREHLGWREKGHDRLDFVLLPLQEGLHVGGVVGTGAAAGTESPLVATLPGSPTRTAVTTRLVNSARLVAVFAPGRAADVRRAVSRFAAKDRRADEPATMLSARSAELRWYLDHAACA